MYVFFLCDTLYFRLTLIHTQFAQVLKKMMIEYYVNGHSAHHFLLFAQSGFTKTQFEKEKKKFKEQMGHAYCTPNVDILMFDSSDKKNRLQTAKDKWQHCYHVCNEKKANNKQPKSCGHKRKAFDQDVLEPNVLKKRKHSDH